MAMTQFAELGEVLIGSRVISKAQWKAAVQTGDGDLAAILEHLADDKPHWWDGKPPAPPGLTEYQRDIIRLRVEDGEFDKLRRDLALNQFILLDKLGQGGQGEVFRGRQLNPPRYAAIKTLIRETDVRRRRFEQEARAMMKIEHPAVAQFYLYERLRSAEGEPTNEYLIAMELVNGVELHKLVLREGKVPWPFAVHWTIELLGGLAEIHKSGLIHRDVKPENVMIVGPLPGPDVQLKQTAAKLLDFGAVKTMDDDREGLPPEKVFVGTMEYAAPEVWAGEITHASDIYSLGGALFVMLARRTPYQKRERDRVAYMNSHLHDDVPDILRYNPDIPVELNRLFQRMMSKDPEERGTAGELIDEFRTLLKKETGRSAPIQKPPPRAKPAPTPTPTTKVRAPEKSKTRSEPQNPLYRLLDPVLALLERLFIPGHLRPHPGEEPPVPERISALLRRPMMLLLLVVLMGLLVWLLR
jgi:serine/threonine protein kinase